MKRILFKNEQRWVISSLLSIFPDFRRARRVNPGVQAFVDFSLEIPLNIVVAIEEFIPLERTREEERSEERWRRNGSRGHTTIRSLYYCWTTMTMK